ncbi:MAG: endonuclease/exonuclease/phosphatase family protein [Phycisphaeraceae bacterium]|nr:endonuclease/exonuclease/phosphatase family protein [Phycisphaeraceae bacterium]
MKYLPPVLLLLACALMPGCSGYPSAPLTLRPQAADQPRDLRIVSVNLRRPVFTDGPNYWSHRRDNLAATLRQVNPDIIATQECLASPARDLMRGLPGYRCVGAGRDDGKLDGEMCAVFFDSRRFDLLDAGSFWLSNQPAKPGTSFDGAWFPRMATWVKLHDRVLRQDFFLFNTHFSTFSNEARIESAQLLRQQIDHIAGRTPFIVTGDFNDGEGSTTYRTLTAAGSEQLFDTYRISHPQRSAYEGTRHEFSGKTTGERMDWILTSSAFATEDAGILRQSVTGRPVSDHYPVTATVRLTATPALAMQPAPRRTVSP